MTGIVAAAAVLFPGPAPIVEAVPAFPACEIWVSSMTGHHVAIIDAHTSQTSSLNVGQTSTGIAATPDGTKVYVAHNSQILTEVNRSGGNSLSTIAAPGHTIAVSPSGDHLYAVDPNTGRLLEISTATSAPTGRSATVGATPIDIVISRDGAYIYVVNSLSDSISKVSTADFAVTTHQYQAFFRPTGIALSPDGSTLYVANTFLNTLEVVRTSDMTVLRSVGVSGMPIDVEINSSGSVIYVLTMVNGTVVEIPTDTLIPRLNPVVVGSIPQILAIAPDDSQLFTTNLGDDTVSRIDLAARTVIETIQVNNDPIGIALVPANCTVTPQQAPAPVVPIWRATMDPAGGVCADGGVTREAEWTSVFVGYRYLPGASDCEREGYSFAGWADADEPDTPLRLPLLVDPADGEKRAFVATDHSLVAVWAKVEETPELPEDLSGTAPGSFVGGPDRRTREGGGVVDGYYIPPRTQFGPWMLAIRR